MKEDFILQNIAPEKYKSKEKKWGNTWRHLHTSVRSANPEILAFEHATTLHGQQIDSRSPYSCSRALWCTYNVGLELVNTIWRGSPGIRIHVSVWQTPMIRVVRPCVGVVGVLDNLDTWTPAPTRTLAMPPAPTVTSILTHAAIPDWSTRYTISLHKQDRLPSPPHIQSACLCCPQKKPQRKSHP